MKYDSWEDIYKARQANSASNSQSAAQYLKAIALSIWRFVVSNINKLRSPHPLTFTINSDAMRPETALPSEVYAPAVFKGVAWSAIIFIALMVLWRIDGALSINILSPEDMTKRLNYFVVTPNVPYLNVRKENDTTFVVDIPLTRICSATNLEIPKGKWVYGLQVTPIGVELPVARIQNKDSRRFKVAKYGGYLTLSEDGSPYYVMMEEMFRSTGVMNPYSFYGAPQIVIDGLAHLASEGVGYQATKRQQLSFGVNLYQDDGSIHAARGFYRFRFVITSNKFAR